MKRSNGKRRGTRPPFFVPDEIKEKEDGNEHLLESILVELVPKSTMEVVPHTFTNVENFLLYQMQHNYILNQQKVKPKWISLNLVLNNTEVNVVAINADSLAATDEPSKY